MEGLRAGYGRMEVLHGVSLRLARGRSLCLIGPNGAGKSTVLHSMFGFTRITGGRVDVGEHDVRRMSPADRVLRARIGYVLQANSVFPGMSVEKNLWMGGYLLKSLAAAREAADGIFQRYPRLAERRRQPAGVLSGGERRLLEIARVLIMEPDVLLVDEPSIGLDPRHVEMVFEILHGLQHDEGKTVILVEQNARRGLEYADIGYVLVSGQLTMAGTGDDLLHSDEVARQFLGGGRR